MITDRWYEQLERVRNLLANAEASPLRIDVDQQTVIEALEQVRTIYRRNYDAWGKRK